jgi:putative membrane-bound dehydrogenase-like protein
MRYRNFTWLLLLPGSLLLAQGYRPDIAASKMTTPPGIEVRLFASEPHVRQPVAIDFDDRGRAWVMQYLQYPNPAGLTRIQVDRYSRTVYDRIPPPPPRGPRGDDRLTILLDTTGSGRIDRTRDFVTGLNLASAFAFGHGGVYVLQAPWLLFYPDRDGDDVPDDEPEVLLAGFGMEDAHSVANSLTWGPDGWLYGCQGSTVTARIRGIEFQQGVWRYHPLTRRFELFCEGGGNSWGLDFDRHGNLFYSTNHGGYVMLHGVQGGYYWKSFGKHGPLHNPFALGYFDHVPHAGFRGGHVSVGGIVYRGDAFPARFRDRYLAADLLGHNVYWHEIVADGSSFRSRHGGELLLSNDTWFAPSDVVLGPDGAVYVADWHDKRTAHPDPDADWDRSNGRIYRIAPKGTKSRTGLDLQKLSSSKLVEMLAHPNDWFVRRARRILAERRDPEVIFPLRDAVRTNRDEHLALESFWAVYVSGGFTDPFAAEVLHHPNPHIRRWTIRFLGDDRKLGPTLARQVIELAGREPHPVVRSQLASSAKRWPAEVGLPIVRALLRHEDARDPHIPLLLWWAVEQHALSALEDVLDLFAGAKGWESAVARDTIQPRLLRRLAAAGTAESLRGCARLLAAAPASQQGALLLALDQGLADRPPGLSEVPSALRSLLGKAWHEDATDAGLLRVLLRLGDERARRRVLHLACDPHTPVSLRTTMLSALGELGRQDCVPGLLGLIGAREAEEVQLAALDALARFERADMAVLVGGYRTLTPRVRARVRSVLLGRRAWAWLLVDEVAAGRIDSREVTVADLQPVARFGDVRLEERVRKLWGRVRSATPEEKLAEVRRLANDLRAGSGDARAGRLLFEKRCGSCHRLHGEGGTLGPDLTHANRQDQHQLLVHIVDPSAVIRKEYLSFTVQTTDGRVLTGLLTEQTPGHVTLVNAQNEKTTIPREKIQETSESPISLMPENLLRDLKPQELRDLFRYLQSDRPR